MSTQSGRRIPHGATTHKRIVARDADQGTTNLGTDRHLPKCDARVEAYGEVDELNAVLALTIAALPAHSAFRPWLVRIQNDLLDLGADLAARPKPEGSARPRIALERVEWLSRDCEQANRLAPLRTLVVASGSEASARLRLAYAVCRRAERHSVALARREPVNPHLLAYLNRLGDLLLVLARAVDADGGEGAPALAPRRHDARLRRRARPADLPLRPAPSKRVDPPPLQLDVPLARYTTFGIGGRAHLFMQAHTSEQLLAAVLWAHDQGVAHLVLGGGSNVLVADDGYDGLVIRNADSKQVELLSKGRVRAESGVAIEHLIALTVQWGLSGLEHFAGIPASLGGALRQNLHFLSPSRDRVLFIGDVLTEATVLVDGEIERVDRDWFAFGRDASTLRAKGAVVLDATLQLTPANPTNLQAIVAVNRAWRRDRHPHRATTRSAGCIFRNPERLPAARAIDAAGLKGQTIGRAAISRRHANFIVNRGGAAADDVRALVTLASDRVAQHSGLQLEPEIAFVGFTDTARAAGAAGAARRSLPPSEHRSTVH